MVCVAVSAVPRTAATTSLSDRPTAPTRTASMAVSPSSSVSRR